MIVDCLYRYFVGLGGLWRTWSIEAGTALKPQKKNSAVHDIFPLPWIVLRRASRGRRRARDSGKLLDRRLANLWVFTLNMMYMGWEWAPNLRAPSKAQQRVLDGLESRACTFLRITSSMAACGEVIQQYMRMDVDRYSGDGRPSRPFGLRAGVPSKAACGEVASLPHDWDPRLAEQCENPDALLKDPSQWPAALVRPFAHVDRSYPDLIEKAGAVGLVDLLPQEEVLHLGGRPAHGGAFAVSKGAT